MPDPADSPPKRAGRSATFLLFALTTAWFTAGVVVPAAGRLTFGFAAYYTASRLALHGDYSERVYEPDYFRAVVRADSDGRADDIWPNLPTTALMMLPIAGLPISAARILWTAANVLFLLAGLGLLVRAYGPRASLAVWLLVFTVAMLFRPVIANFRYGQAYLLTFLLLVLAVVAIGRRRDVVGGVGLGAALALKMTGWPLAILLLWRRRWGYLAAFAGTAALLALVLLPVTGLTSWRAFADYLPGFLNSPSVCATAYQTVRSWLCHVAMPQMVWQTAEALALPWTAQAIYWAAALGTLILSLRLARWRGSAAAAALVVWGVLFAPLGEEHHHTVVLIAVVWLILGWSRGDWRGRAGLVLLGLALVLYVVPFPLNHPRLQEGWAALLAYPRLYGAWLVWLAVQLSAAQSSQVSQSYEVSG
jgi:hypothetical protein